LRRARQMSLARMQAEKKNRQQLDEELDSMRKEKLATIEESELPARP